MDDFNKVVSFILGLVVVVVFIAVIIVRSGVGKRLLPFVGTNTSPTPTMSVSQTSKLLTPTPKTLYGKYQNSVTSTKTPETIPSTGLPTLFIPSLLAAAAAGFKLKKTGRKND